MSRRDFTRRAFLASATMTVAGCARKGAQAPGIVSSRSPNETIGLAAIGCAGQGGRDLGSLAHVKGVEVVALCDVDSQRGAGAFNSWPQAPKYADFRTMIEKESGIDAVSVGIPDNVHAIAALTAMSLGKHVYVQKPLSLTMGEARALTVMARERGVRTQMGNQGHSAVGVREICEMIWDGAIGQVAEVHCWTDRSGTKWGRGATAPLPEQPVPEYLDWDLWLGPAAARPYNNGYHPGNWRGWWDFGTGALGDMACHIMDAANWALQLGPPSTVECIRSEGANTQTAPGPAIVKYEFPARKWKRQRFCPVTLYWYEGGLQPDRPEGIAPDVQLGDGGNGTLFLGEKGVLTCSTYGGNPRLFPEELDRDYKRPDPSLPRARGPYKEWINAIREDRPACSGFAYSGPLTETVLLGVVAMRAGRKVAWDAENMRITGDADASRHLARECREGWALPG
ncbi:MAG: Gfo/Idh/MocA family oxidoreductase [bacterium]|nr:Gfo/Idh/MocA family oxidoreductase [bacterium]